MKILVTGATGFVGKHLLRKLSDDNSEVVISIRPDEKSPFTTRILTHVFNYDKIQDDIAFLKEQELDGVIHLASLYLTTHKPEQAIQLIESNVKFGTHILEASAHAGIEWFINTGTFWQNYDNDEYSPVNLYASTKQAFESIAQYYIETDQIKFCTIKLADTFGPGDSRPKIFNLWDKISKTGEILDMSPGEQVLDLCYIDDIVDCFMLLADHLIRNNPTIRNGEVYSVTAEKRFTLKELAIMFVEATGRKLNINWGGKPYREREVMVPWQAGRRVPGWYPKTSVEDGIKKMYEASK